MDSSKFDFLTKSVVGATSRRHAIRGLAAGLVAGVTGRLAAEPAAAQNNCVSLGGSCKRRRGEPKPKCCGGNTVCRQKRCECKGNRRRCGTECINPNQCCHNSECEGGQKCRQNRCQCPGNQQLCDGQCIGGNQTCATRVTPSKLRGWLPEGEDPFSQNPILTTFVEGPGTPPIGNGSVLLDPQAFDAFPESGTQAVLRTLKYEGTTIGEIDTLGYSINVPGGGDPPTMQLAVVNVNNVQSFTSLVFIPGANGNAAPGTDTWTDYTPTTEGFFASTRDVLGPANECLICRSIGGAAHEGDCVTPANCTPVENVTWAQIQAAMPDAELNDSGSFSFRIGRGDTGAGNLTNVRFNDDLYFFEPDN